MDTIRQYQNDELCEKWSNNIPLSELDKGYYLGDLSQDIDALCEYFHFLPHEDITSFVYKMGNGDYQEVYVTESSRPYSLDAIYHPLSYYL